MFEDIIREVLPNVTGTLKDNLLQQLEAVGKKVLVDEAQKQVARALLKSIDTVVTIAVANLPRGDAVKLGEAYAEALLMQVEQLADAIDDYVPLQVDVEVTKQQHGTTSPQAQAARKRREVGITELRAEVRDVLRAATGDEPED